MCRFRPRLPASLAFLPPRCRGLFLFWPPLAAGPLFFVFALSDMISPAPLAPPPSPSETPFARGLPASLGVASAIAPQVRAALASALWPVAVDGIGLVVSGPAQWPGAAAQGQSRAQKSALAQMAGDALRSSFGSESADPLSRIQLVVLEALARAFFVDLNRGAPAPALNGLLQMANEPLVGDWLDAAMVCAPDALSDRLAVALAGRALRFPDALQSRLALDLANRWSARCERFAQQFGSALFLEPRQFLQEPCEAWMAPGGPLSEFVARLDKHPSRAALRAEAFASPSFFAFFQNAGVDPSPREALDSLILFWAGKDALPASPRRGFQAAASRRWPTGDAKGEDRARNQLARLIELAWPLRAEWPWFFVDFSSQVFCGTPHEPLALRVVQAAARGEIPAPPLLASRSGHFMPWVSALRAMGDGRLDFVEAHCGRVERMGKSPWIELPTAHGHPLRPFCNVLSRMPVPAALKGQALPTSAPACRIAAPTLVLAALATGNPDALALLRKMGAPLPSSKRVRVWQAEHAFPALAGASVSYASSPLTSAHVLDWAEDLRARQLALWESASLGRAAFPASTPASASASVPASPAAASDKGDSGDGVARPHVAKRRL